MDAEAVEVDHGSKAGERGQEVEMVKRGHFLYIFWRLQIDDRLHVISEVKKEKDSDVGCHQLCG